MAECFPKKQSCCTGAGLLEASVPPPWNMKNKILLSSTLALVFTATAPAATLVAQYALAGDSTDGSGNGFDGVDTDISYISDPDRGLVASFNGASSSINVSASGYSITERPNYQFAVSFWIKPTARQDYYPDGAVDLNPIMGATGSGVIEIVGQGSWQGMGGASAYGGMGLNSGGGAGSTAGVEGIDFYDGQWHHVVVQWSDPDGVPSEVGLNSGADATIYIDNQLALDLNSQTYNGNSGQASPSMVLGGPVVWSNGGPADKYYSGLLADVQFFDDQLTPAEVDALFNEVSGPSSGLVLEIATDSETNEVTLTWAAVEGRTYDILGSEDLSSDPTTWTPVSTGVTSPQTLPISSTEQFYVLRESP